MLHQVLGDPQIAYKDALVVFHEHSARPQLGDHCVRFGLPPARNLEQYVVGLDIAMHEAGVVNGRESVGNGIDKRNNALRVRCAVSRFAIEARRQSAAIGKIHDEIWAPVVEPSDSRAPSPRWTSGFAEGDALLPET
jgi:hypothetical protein